MKVLAGLAMAVVAAWCFLSLRTPWTSACVPAFWPHKVVGAAALGGVIALLLLARRRPGLALGLAAIGLGSIILYLVRHESDAADGSVILGRFVRGTAGPFLLGILLTIACVGWGNLVGLAARCKNLSTPERLGLGILVQGMLLLTAGSLSFLPPALGWTLLLLGSLGLIPSLREDLRSARAIALPSAAQCLWIAPAVFTVLFGLLRALAPEVEGDCLRYHLALPRLYAAAGSIGFHDENPSSLMPSLGQMLHLESFLVSGDIPSRILGVASFVAFLRSMFVLARRYDAERLPWIVVGLLGAMIQVREVIGTALPESLVLLFAALSLQRLASLVEDPTESRISLLLAGLFAGGVAACKLIGLMFPVLLALGLLLQDRRRWRTALGLSSLALLEVLPWYLRSYLHTGNPFWPSFASLFGGSVELREQNATLIQELRGHYAVSLSWLQFPLFPVYATFCGARYDGAFDPWIVAWIPLAAATRRPPVLNAGLCMTLGLAVVLYGVFVPITRYFACAFPVLAIAAGWGMLRVPTDGLRRAVGASFLLYAVASAGTHLSVVERALLPVLGFEDRGHYAATWISGYATALHASHRLPRDAKVLMVDSEGGNYPLERPSYGTNPLVQQEFVLSRIRDTRELLDRLKRRNVGFVIARNEDPFPGIPGDRGMFLPLFTADGWSLFEVQHPSR